MRIPPVDNAAGQAAAQRQQQLIKPRGALGRLEELACWFAARQGRAIPELQVAITVFAADHGVAAQGVSAYPQSVTREMLRSLANGRAAIAVLARDLRADYAVIDVGVLDAPHLAGVQHSRIAPGTQDLSQRAAMSAVQVQQAMQVGAQAAQRAIDAGANLLIAGEIGIGNTTSAACLISRFTGHDPELIVGTGTGVDQAGREHKLQLVQRALQRIPHLHEPELLLAEVGGLEIAAMVGYYLQAAQRGVPSLLDGFIAAAAAITACALVADVRDWLLAAHQSAERGHALALQHLQLTPLLDLQLRLGEGSGAALAVPLIQQALSLHRHMATFAEAGITQ